MAGGAVRGLVFVGLCVVAALAGEERGMLARPAPGPEPAFVEMPPRQRPTAVRPVLRGGIDGKRAWLGAEHRGLIVRKVSSRVDGSMQVELQYRRDVISIALNRAGGVAVARGGTRVEVTSVEAFEQLQQVLAGSEAAFAARVMLAEREAASELQAAEMSMLSAAAFVASLVGDVDAPRRLSARFVEKHHGRYRPVRFRTCFDEYARESSAAWNDMQSCMSEANQDESIFNRAYRRVACNAVWLVRSESAWIEYLGCLGPGQLFPQ
jgi:hypothetical protein